MTEPTIELTVSHRISSISQLVMPGLLCVHIRQKNPLVKDLLLVTCFAWSKPGSPRERGCNLSTTENVRVLYAMHSELLKPLANEDLSAKETHC